jgi:IS30 family transposase
VENRTAGETARALICALSRLPVRTVAADNGYEFAHHRQMGGAPGADFYFCHPYHA